MVGNGDNDIDSILSSHVGINLNIPNNIDNILSHYFTLDNNLYCIEKIIKNGRAAYENSFLLLCSLLICSSLETLLNVFSYFLLVKLKNSQLLIMNVVFFVLASTAFKMKADNSIDKNPLFQNRLFNIYNIIKMIIIFFGKITIQIFYYYLYDYNPDLSDEINRKVLCSYLYLLCIFQGISTIFIFNKENFFRITAENNKLFIIIFSLVLHSFFFIIGFSNINYRPFYFDIVYFEYYETNCDSYDDMHKLKLILYISVDFIFTYGFIKILKYIFEKQANKREREYLIKKMKYRAEEEKENEKEIKNKEEEERKKVNQIFPSSGS
jgi:magnesium-transporting ATPase (P-type)